MFHDTWHQVIDFLNIKDRNTHLRTCKDALTMSKNHGWLVLCHKLIGNTHIFKVDRYKQLLNTNSANIIKEYVRANWFFLLLFRFIFIDPLSSKSPYIILQWTNI